MRDNKKFFGALKISLILDIKNLGRTLFRDENPQKRPGNRVFWV